MSGRPKGYMEWTPKGDVAVILDQVDEVFETYRANLPLTVRQIFYRLVGAFDYPKDERAYKRLAEYLVKARRSERIPFGNIRDDGISSTGGGGYDSPTDWWATMRTHADYYRRDRQDGQPVRLEVWCEAAGMVPQLVRVASPFSVPVLSSGGFTSLTGVREIADRVLDDERPTLLLHLGDYDPSGESIFESMSQDVWSFVSAETGDGERFEGKRVALTADQVETHNLPTAPPKSSDSRSAAWVGETCQLEAMPPDLLASTLRDAIWHELEDWTYDEVVAAEKRERELLQGQVKRAIEELS